MVTLVWFSHRPDLLCLTDGSFCLEPFISGSRNGGGGAEVVLMWVAMAWLR